MRRLIVSFCYLHTFVNLFFASAPGDGKEKKFVAGGRFDLKQTEIEIHSN